MTDAEIIADALRTAWEEVGMTDEEYKALVAREPTVEMVSAGLDALEKHFNDHDDGFMIRQIWRAMWDKAQQRD